ncbi:alpha/beta hydrolase [Streptomyces sp. NBC_00984]|uniref:alpha/beta fold hydrolase n=1 Tax=Streptomyces sp. NBC_00984 TaxID=2903700 RepID=UPI00386ED3CF|nr:alpha/beta hydrolase [Streptomyces sp. NBC_00984]
MTTAFRTTAHREIRRGDRTTIRYTASGPTGGPVLVLLHGWACHRGDFDELTRHLPAELRVLAVDLAEHGESRSTRAVWTMEEFARDVQTVLEAESVGSAVVAGHSMGAAVAVEVGRALPEKVSHVVALDGLHYLSLFPAQEETRAEKTLRAFREDFPAAVRGLVEGGTPPGTDPALTEAYTAKMSGARQPAGLRSMEGLVHWDMDAALRETRQPITVFAIRSLTSQKAIDRYNDRFDFDLVELGSHHFPVESPKRTAGLLAKIVNR